VPDATIPKRRGPALLRVLGSLVGWGMFFGLALGALGFWAWGVFTTEGPLSEAKTITLTEGTSRADIAQILQDNGIISDTRVMNVASYVSSYRGGTLKSGEYEFAAGTPMAGVLNAILSGRVVTYKLTIPEGWTSQMALQRINENDVLTGPPIASLPEGAVIADTQVFRRGMTRDKLVQDMQSDQVKLLDEIWVQKSPDSILKTKEELLTLASIVEKETGKPEERPRVAAVFLNRLKKGMRLQSDPTIIYGIVGGAGKLERALTRSDIDAKTPYNTYQIDGLPPGPIATPGRASLEAVVAPAVSEDLFFVADGTGGHAFAATLDEHNANVKKWREGQKNGIQLPGETETTEPPALNEVQQTPLPAVENQPVVGDDAAVDEAAKTAEKSQAVPVPVEGQGAQPVAAAPKPAEPPPLPVIKKPKPTAPDVVVDKKPTAEKSEVVVDKKPAEPKPVAKAKPKPGSVVKVGTKLVPIPKLKKPKP
jgi:UPF0755 protein